MSEDSLQITITPPPSMNLIVVQQPQPLAQTIGVQGPKGSKGESGIASAIITKVAGETLSGHRAIALIDDLAYYADPSRFNTAFHTVGISTISALIDDEVDILTSGELEASFWNWDMGKLIYVGGLGQLTQTPPTTGYILIIAKAISSTKIFVEIQNPIILV